jgi:hypothetical protein
MRSGERERGRLSVNREAKRKSSIGRWHGIDFWRVAASSIGLIDGFEVYSETIARSVIFQ